MTSMLEAQHVSFAYSPDRLVLQDISFSVSAGTFLAIAGPNGAGKSTLLNVLAGLRGPQAGDVLLEGRSLGSCPVQDIARRVAVVRQEFIPAFGFSVAETVLMARTPYFGPLGFESRADRELAAQALALTDTTAFAARPLSSLSAGERQRVFIARALAQDTPVLLLDEPTSFLDFKHQVRIYDLLKTVQVERHTTIVAVTHDLNLALQYCDETLLLHAAGGGSGDHPRYRIGRTSDILTPAEVERAFGVRIFAGMVDKERYLVPLGAKAKDSNCRRPPHDRPRRDET